MNKNFLNSSNASYIAELFIKFKENSKSIDKDWTNFFLSLKEDDLSILADFGGPK